MIEEVRDRARLERLLSADRALHIYELGDLDPFFFPNTRWFVHEDAVGLLYTGSFGSTLLAFSSNRALLREAAIFLPAHFYTHLSPGLGEALAETHELEEAKPAFKMALRDRSRIESVDTSNVVQVQPDELAGVEALYRDHYPGNWFDARMLETGCYFGIRDGAGGWTAIAGVHVYSPVYRVAALGNIVTATPARGRGLGTKVTAAACRHMFSTVEIIGLNVMRDNPSAIACYHRLGFEVVAEYEERYASKRPR